MQIFSKLLYSFYRAFKNHVLKILNNFRYRKVGTCFNSATCLTDQLSLNEFMMFYNYSVAVLKTIIVIVKLFKAQKMTQEC